MKLFRPAPLKFFHGTSNLWGGLPEKENIIFQRNDVIYFNSARTALLFILKNLPDKYGNTVMVTSFTCEAVFDAIIASGKEPIQLDINLDLSFCIRTIYKEFELGCKILLLQNTLGQIGLCPLELEYLMKKGCFVISDNSLAYGTRLKELDVSSLGHLSLESYEVSKTLTCGWGGAVNLKNSPKLFKEKLYKKYALIDNLPLNAEIREYFQMKISRKFIRKHNPFAFLLWYFFYAVLIFKKSHIAREKLNKNIFKINNYNKKLIQLSDNEKNKIYSITNKNYLKIDKLRSEAGLRTIQKNLKFTTDFIVSPRYPVILRKPFDSILEKLFLKNKIDIGRWFSFIPKTNSPSKKIFKNTEFLNSHIINIPTHHILKDEDFQRIEKLFFDMAKNDF